MKNLLFALTAIALSGFFCAPDVSAALYDQWHDQEKQVFSLVNLQRNYNGLSDLIPDSRLQEAADLHSRDMAVNGYFNHDSQDGTEFWQRIEAQRYDFRYCGENIAAGYPNAYNVMFGTDDLSRLSDFDVALGMGHDGFSSWDEVGQSWSDENWEDWDRVIPPELVGRTDQKDGFGGWMGSTGHRDNILSANFTDIGVGYYHEELGPSDYDDLHYWTQDFASGDTAPNTAPVPIPPAILLLGSGLGMVGFRRYKKK